MTKKPTDLYLSVVIPSYNETENLEAGVLDQVHNYLRKQKYSWEVIVSDDGSPDERARQLARAYCAKSPGFTFLENDHGGKPFALWAGIGCASGEIILLTDMDQSTPIGQVEKLIPYYDEGFDIVIGSRGRGRKNFSLFRLVASFIFRSFRRIFLLRNITDTQCGFKSLKKDVAMDIFPRMEVIKKGKPEDGTWHVGAWDTEMLFIAEKFGYKIKEVQVEWANRDLSMQTKKSTSKGKFIRESIEMIQEVVRVRLNDIQSYYQK